MRNEGIGRQTYQMLQVRQSDEKKNIQAPGRQKTSCFL